MRSLKPFLSSNPHPRHVMGRQATPHRREEPMGHHVPCPVAILLALALLCIPSTNARADLLLHGIGAIGSSTTDEYQFSPLHSTARN